MVVRKVADTIVFKMTDDKLFCITNTTRLRKDVTTLLHKIPNEEYTEKGYTGLMEDDEVLHPILAVKTSSVTDAKKVITATKDTKDKITDLVVAKARALKVNHNNQKMCGIKGGCIKGITLLVGKEVLEAITTNLDGTIKIMNKFKLVALFDHLDGATIRHTFTSTQALTNALNNYFFEWRVTAMTNYKRLVVIKEELARKEGG